MSIFRYLNVLRIVFLIVMSGSRMDTNNTHSGHSVKETSFANDANEWNVDHILSTEPVTTNEPILRLATANMIPSQHLPSSYSERLNHLEAAQLRRRLRRQRQRRRRRQHQQELMEQYVLEHRRREQILNIER
jgi:hypothetical protein